MFLSVFDVFKVGIGPSSSHTVGPMLAAGRFLEALAAGPSLAAVTRVRATLYGSLAFTGKGHATDQAVILGLAGERPDLIDPDSMAAKLAAIAESGTLALGGGQRVPFDAARDVVFDYGPALPGHANGLVLAAWTDDGDAPAVEETYYSIGGGFVATAAELDAARLATDVTGSETESVPYPFATAQQMLEMGGDGNLTIAEMKRANELTRMDVTELDAGLARLWSAMTACIERGLRQDGMLPGGLKVKRRAKAIRQALAAEEGRNAKFQHTVMDWISVYALAVNEENAGGGRVVTAPTNGVRVNKTF